MGFRLQFIIFSILIFTVPVLPQFISFANNYGHLKSWEEASDFEINDDGCFVICGKITSSEDVEDALHPGVYVLMVDYRGELIWEKSYNLILAEATAITKTTDGGYAITGEVTNSDNERDIYILKIDNDGDSLWCRVFHEDKYEIGHSIQQTQDGGYIVAGNVGTRTRKDISLIKTNSAGELEWRRRIDFGRKDEARDIIQSENGDFILTGYIAYGSQSNLLIMRLDKFGNMIKYNRYLAVNSDGYNILQLSHGGFAISGHRAYHSSMSEQAMLLFFDENLELVSDHNFGGTGSEYAYSFTQTSDKGFALCGATGSWGNGESDVYMIKTDSVGNFLWHRTIGSIEDDFAYSIAETPDSGLVAVGRYTRMYNRVHHRSDVYVIKTDANGEIVTGFPHTIQNHIKQLDLSQNYPNPFNPSTTISFSIPKTRFVTLKIVNNRGQLIKMLINDRKSAGTHRIVWNRQDEKGRLVASGVYFYTLEIDDTPVSAKKLVLLR